MITYAGLGSGLARSRPATAFTQGSQVSSGSGLAGPVTHPYTHPAVTCAPPAVPPCTTVGAPGLDFALNLQPLGDAGGGGSEPAANSRITCIASVAVNPTDPAGRDLNAVMAVSMFAGLLNTCGSGPGIDVRAILSANEGLTGLAATQENVEWVESVLAGTAVRSRRGFPRVLYSRRSLNKSHNPLSDFTCGRLT